ncbi:beta strand repeat-containing protein [Curvivirga aplysinae]|uniref:beta strand repeat-containing protein n=1 Tax=Curvivirga aplysinae TaxID=2529852 RepID=UPI0012BD040C|nr:hypothetical protein [Curvivirga aplysinae]MTI09563.1 hypothetical protein [Curvivirga aplysinae]
MDGATLTVDGSTLTSTDQGTLKFTNVSGISSVNSGVLNVDGSSSSSSGVLEVYQGTLTTDNVDLNIGNHGKLVIDDSLVNAQSGGSISSTGTLDFATGTLSGSTLSLGGDFTNNGLTTFTTGNGGSNVSASIETNGNTFTNAGSLSLGNSQDGTVTIDGAFVNSGVLSMAMFVEVINDEPTPGNASTLTFNSSFTNSGTLDLAIGSEFSNNGTESLINSGTLSINSTNAGDDTISNITTNITNTGKITLDSTNTQVNLQGDVDTSNGDLFIASNSKLKFDNDATSTLTVTQNTGLSGDSGAELHVNNLEVASGVFQVNDTDITLNIDNSVTASSGTIIYSDTNITDNVSFFGNNHIIDQGKTLSLASSTTLTLNGDLTNNGTIDSNANSGISFSNDTHYTAKSYDDSGTLKFTGIENDTPNDGSSITGAGEVELRLDATHNMNHGAWNFMTADTINDNFQEILVVDSTGSEAFSNSYNGTTVVGSLSLTDNNGLDTFALDLTYVTSDGVDNSGDLVFTGTSGQDVFFGGSGDDVATDGGDGDDIFYGNGGNDTFTLSDGTSSASYYINGGAGDQDVLKISNVDLSTNSWHINEFEIIDIISFDPEITVDSAMIKSISEDTNSALSGVSVDSSLKQDALVFYAANSGIEASINIGGEFTSRGTISNTDTSSMGAYADTYSIYEDTTNGGVIYVGSNVSVNVNIVPG